MNHNETFNCADLSHIQEPIQLHPGDMVAFYSKGNYEMSVSVDTLAHLGAGRVDVEYQGKEYFDWKEFPKELQEAILHDEQWRNREGINVIFEPSLHMDFDGFPNADELSAPVEDESAFLGKTSEEIQSYMKTYMHQVEKDYASYATYTAYREDALPEEWKNLPVGDDPITEGMVEGSVAAVTYFNGKDNPYDFDWATDATYSKRSENIASRLANFDKKGYEFWLRDTGNYDTIQKYQEAGDKENLRAAVLSTFESYVGEVHPSRPSALTKGLAKVLQSKDFDKMRKTLTGYVEGDKKTIKAIEKLGKAEMHTVSR